MGGPLSLLPSTSGVAAGRLVKRVRQMDFCLSPTAVVARYNPCPDRVETDRLPPVGNSKLNQVTKTFLVHGKSNLEWK